MEKAENNQKTTNKVQRHILPTYALEDVILMLDDEELMERDFGISYCDRGFIRKDAYNLKIRSAKKEKKDE